MGIDQLLLLRMGAIALGYVAAIYGVVNELKLKKANDENKQSIRRNKNIGYVVAVLLIFVAIILKYLWIKDN